MRCWIAALAFTLPFTAALAAVKEDPVTYKTGDTTMKGYVVYDDAVKGKRPGVLVVRPAITVAPCVTIMPRLTRPESSAKGISSMKKLPV